LISQQEIDWVSSWLISDLMKEFLGSGGFVTLGSWQIPIYGMIGFVISIILFWQLYRIFTKLISKILKNRGLTPDVLNGIKFLIRLIIIILLLTTSLSLLNISADYILIFGSLITTAIAFASMKSITNLVAGVWLILTRPISIGDYVEISGIEGIVSEISLNYILIKERNGNMTQIPNINCIQSKITNYTISTNWFEEKIQQFEQNYQRFSEQQKLHQSCYLENLDNLKQQLHNIEEIQSCLTEKGACIDKEYSVYVRKGKIVRYCFTMEFPRNHQRNAEILQTVCKKWTEKFEIEPKWQLINIQTFFIYQFLIYTPDPEDILRYFDDFLKDLYVALFS